MENRKEKAVEQLLEVYAKLVASASVDANEGREPKWLCETVAGLTEKEAKALLIARVLADAQNEAALVNRAVAA
jgi:hypothetical protein